ncbi:MAG: aminoacyl-tRNA hydrolase [Alphaproteobacteria bacterium]|nr:aminoacyl-tRNA hydrolase [Alphaproteobacteria bacterium]
MDDLVINDLITIPGTDLEVSFSRSGGPGGQHVNTTDTRVRLHFDLRGTTALYDGVKRRIAEAEANRINKDGQLVITSDTYRSRHRNLEEVRERLVQIVRDNLVPPKKRKATKPSLGAKKRRMETKKKRSDVKSKRGKVRLDD